MGDVSQFLSRLAKARSQMERARRDSGIVIHHDEADGLASGALAKLALENMGLRAELICLDKLHPEVVAEVETRPGKVIVYADLGSGHVDWLRERNKAGNLIIILDHHDTTDISDPLVLNLNPELDGFSGEKDCSSSTVAYFFCKTVDPSLSNYAHLALVGSVEVPGNIQGLNLLVAEEAEKLGAVTKTKGDYRIDTSNGSVSRSRFASILNLLGSVGYFRDGPRIGVDACVNGLDAKTVDLAGRFEDERRIANRRMLSTIREKGLSQMKTVQWFHAEHNYSGMSGKVVGSFCSYLRYQRGINPLKYLVGMMHTPPEIPGWGKLSNTLVKVSARSPAPLASMIETGAKPPLSKILPQACERAGGFGDGHTVAASGVFPKGGEEKFLREMDRLASE